MSWMRESVRGGFKPGFMLSTSSSRTREAWAAEKGPLLARTAQLQTNRNIDEDISVLVDMSDAEDKENAPVATTPTPRKIRPTPDTHKIKQQELAHKKELLALQRETEKVKKQLAAMQKENKTLRKDLDAIEEKYSSSLETIVNLQMELFLAEITSAYEKSEAAPSAASQCSVCHTVPAEGWSAYVSCGHELCRVCIRSPHLHECPICRDKNIGRILNVYRP